jgi:hypothetical protein
MNTAPMHSENSTTAHVTKEASEMDLDVRKTRFQVHSKNDTNSLTIQSKSQETTQVNYLDKATCKLLHVLQVTSVSKHLFIIYNHLQILAFAKSK